MERVVLIKLFSSGLASIASTHLTERVGEKTLNGDENLGDGERETPVVLYRVDAHVAVPRDVRMKDPREEANSGRAHGVAVGHLQVQVEQAALVRAADGARDSRLPVDALRVQGQSFDAFRRVGPHVCRNTTNTVEVLLSLFIIIFHLLNLGFESVSLFQILFYLV